MDRFWKEVRGLLGAVAIAFFIRTFFMQPFIIPSDSMYPTMMKGDVLVVSKYTYGYSNYTFPFAPDLFEGRIHGSRPERGQVIVFRNPIDETKSLFKKMTFRDDSLDYIKRVVGLPGDRIQMKEGVLHINGEAVKLQRIEDYTYRTTKTRELKTIPQYIETMPNGKSYHIIKEVPFGQANYDNTPEYLVPEGHYFCLGDNRDNSGDSRVFKMLGFVPEDHLIGPARWVIFSTSAGIFDFGEWISGIRFSRTFTSIN